MHTFVVDETNKDYVENHFFIVGGLVITEAQVPLVDYAVACRRREAGFRPGDSFKFDTNARPTYVDAATHREAKKNLVADLKQIGVRMIVSVVLHDLCKTQDYNTRMDWALNTLAGAYRKLLTKDGFFGYMVIDRDNDRFDHLEHLFQDGLQFGGRNVALHDRIKLFAMTSDNASNLSSAADIALGAFRYCANTAAGQGREDVAKVIFPNLASIMWSEIEPVGEKIINYGYHPRPKPESVYHAPMKERYVALAAALREYSIDPLDAL